MALWLIGLVLVVLVAAHLIVVVYLADLMTRSPRRRVAGAPADLGLRFESVEFPADPGIRLRGWYLESPGARGSVVLVHDARQTRSAHGALGLQREYVRRGFHVLAFDLRGHGESTGGRGGLGGAERRDVEAAVMFAHRRAPALPVVLHGFGMGGALALDAAAAGQPVAGVIADSAFADACAQLRRRWRHVPGYLVRRAIALAARFAASDPAALRPRAAAAQLDVPALLIHAEGDPVTPASDSVNIAAHTVSDRVWLWTPPGETHCGSYLAQPEVYLRRCLELLDRAVPMRLVIDIAPERDRPPLVAIDSPSTQPVLATQVPAAHAASQAG